MSDPENDRLDRELHHARQEIRDATMAGYRSMTTPYYLPAEHCMMNNVIGDLRRGGIDFLTIEIMEIRSFPRNIDGQQVIFKKVVNVGSEVWRKGYSIP